MYLIGVLMALLHDLGDLQDIFKRILGGIFDVDIESLVKLPVDQILLESGEGGLELLNMFSRLFIVVLTGYALAAFLFLPGLDSAYRGISSFAAKRSSSGTNSGEVSATSVPSAVSARFSINSAALLVSKGDREDMPISMDAAISTSTGIVRSDRETRSI